MMNLQVRSYDLETVIRFRESMLYLDLSHRQELELEAFHSRFVDQLDEQDMGATLLGGLLTDTSPSTVTLEIPSYEVRNYRRLANDITEPFPLSDTQPEAYHNEIFRDWCDVAHSWANQLPDSHLPSSHKRN